jgi:hypothetical protein
VSRLRISNLPGDDGWLVEIPGFARTRGYSGQMVVGVSAPATNGAADAARRKASYWADPEAERAKKRDRYHSTNRCGRTMHNGRDVCARIKGHGNHCATRKRMDHVNQTRRKAA